MWQWSAAARDIYKAATDPVAKASYFDPVREYLRLRPDQRRVEIPFTLGHWEGAEVASDVPLARGWLRQLDTGRNPIFYKGGLNELTYASWLSENAVRYVALPDAKPDTSAYRERGADRARPALPQAAGDLRALAHLRGHAADAVVISPGRREHRARAARLRRAAAAREAPGARWCGCAGPRTGWPRAAAWSATGDWTRVTARRRASCGSSPASGPSGSSSAAGAATAADGFASGPSPCAYALVVRQVSHDFFAQFRGWNSSSRWLPQGWLDALRQLALFAGAYYAYRIVRGLVDGQATVAFENARALVDAGARWACSSSPACRPGPRAQQWMVTARTSCT